MGHKPGLKEAHFNASDNLHPTDFAKTRMQWGILATLKNEKVKLSKKNAEIVLKSWSRQSCKANE